ncbi:MAG: IS1380 family transposase [Planctomycetes bacterium]|nr:IS1380 family transposase [Planctomycetota bacterium]
MRDSSRQRVLFSSVDSRPFEVAFDEPSTTSDGGALLLKALDSSVGVTAALAAGMHDARCSGKVRHALLELVRQRVYGIACGYVDGNDAGRMASDPLHGLLCEAADGLASQPTLSRFENHVLRTSLWRMGKALMETVIAAQRRRHRGAKRITIDLDGTVDPTHGHQQQSLFHGKYGTWCDLPLMGFISFDDAPKQHLAVALLRRLVPALRAAFRGARIVVRLDAGFAGPALFDLLNDLEVEYVVAMAGNAVLERESADLMQKARRISLQTGESVRLFGEARYAARSWHEVERRVIYKAEVVREAAKPPQDNPRYVVTNLRRLGAGKTYDFYCQRGDTENRIKELKDDLSIDRTSCTSFAANQLRLLLTAAAYVLYQELRCRITAKDEVRAQVGTLRLQLIKIGGRVVQTVRRVVLHLAASHPWRDRWRAVVQRCGALPLAALA